MKIFLIIAIVVSNICNGQELKFKTSYFDAVDKWVAFDKKEEDSSYVVGFIYIDQQAGFTFDFESRFMITDKGLKKLPRDFDNSLKSRLSQNTADVAVLTEEQVQQLQLPKQPEWLKHYKTNETEPSYLVQIGYHFNHVGASKNAIEPLTKAYQKDFHFKGVEFELSYAYNATKQYEKAIEVLTKAIQHDPNNFWFYRELGFSYKNLNRISDAEIIYQKGISISNDNAQKAEMAVNMAQSYFKLKDKQKFDEWARIVRQYSEKGSQFEQYLQTWEKSWDKK